MSAWDEIERARSLPLSDVDGNAVELVVAPPLPEAQIEELARRVGLPLPRELVELLRRCCGVEGILADAIGEPRHVPVEGGWPWGQVFPHAISIASDGGGDEWVLDLTSATSEVAPVFLVCHEGGVRYQSPDLAHFFREAIRSVTPPHRSLFDQVYEDELFDTRGFQRGHRPNPGAVARAAALDAAEPALRAFAATLDDRFEVMDLRRPEVGMGFWYGPSTILRRHGEERIFAWARPERRGLWSRLTGRG